MKCREAERLFYEVGEERLDPEALLSLRAHEESCSRCRQEFAAWRVYRKAFESEAMRITPPPGFAARVISRLEEAAPSTGSSRRGILEAFRRNVLVKGAIAAAAALALLTGSLAFAEKYWFNSSAPRIVQEETDGRSAPGGLREDGKEDGKIKEEVQVSSPQEEAAPGEAAAEPESGEGETETGNSAPTPNVPKPKPEKPAANEDRQYRFMDNKKRVITTTMVKATVADIEQAHRLALGIAQSEGAEVTSTVTARNNGRANLILRCTVPPERAKSLISRLEGLGTVKTRDTSVTDVTNNFSRTLEEYRSLSAKLAEAPEGEKEQLRNQVEFLARQLQEWDEASEKEVIVLWLED